MVLISGRVVLLLALGVVVVGGVMLALNWLPGGAPAPAAPQPASQQDSRDSWRLSDLSGETTGPADYQGKVVLVNFWATRCGYCVEEMPDMEKAARARAGQVAILAVNFGESQKAVESFLSGKGYSFRVLLDAEGKVAARYGIRALPTTLVFDRAGNLVRKVEGAIREAAFLKLIDEAAK
ncbi:MAG: TlpA family protein disulfide reductase [Firmicutes bacterium]|nr:TlpA family protein disulfide reductase [Bacillota bacterium]